MPHPSDPSPIRRFSSRTQRLDRSFLADRLCHALAYDRIAGYFCSSILETAGEALETVQSPIRMVCNSGLQPQDVATARAAAAVLRQEWCGSRPEQLVDAGGAAAKGRLRRLYELLITGKLQVKVLPDKYFGLIHGKAGVITLADGSKTAFLGSVNETRPAWTLNYELLWEDTSAEAVAWVQEEFDALWTHHGAVPLAEFVIEDIERLSRREVITSVDEWLGDTNPKRQRGDDLPPLPRPSLALRVGIGRDTEEYSPPAPAPVFIETPVYRQQVGLWEHQKYFVKLAFDAHLQSPGGARFVLADQVGLGKTIQLAMAAELMALTGTKPVIVLAPKTLLWQWQGEMRELLDMPSAVWNGRQWVDENGLEYPVWGPEGIKKCPRRVGLISTGLITAGSEAADYLRLLRFECVIVDEAHRARRKNLGEDRDGEKPEPNNLLRFLYEISTKTKSMLLATATPVQLRLVEAWDLLDVLSRGSKDAVLGGPWSLWRRADLALPLVMGQADPPADDLDMWEWIRTPLPPRSEHRDFDIIRRALGMSDEQVSATGSDWERLKPPDNPFIRHIVRRSRKYLEETRDPATGEPYLKPIRVELLGEDDADAIRLPLYLQDAYLQRLGTLINLDLPWNPTRLEQRKGRIQRIGQLNDVVYVYNMRYLGSVEDRVHQLLSSRLQEIYTLFGQVPDVLEDVWIDVALGDVERAKKVIAAAPKQHPFDIKYQRIEKVDWESCEQVLSATAKQKALTEGW
jgi:hypothetical protein